MSRSQGGGQGQVFGRRTGRPFGLFLAVALVGAPLSAVLSVALPLLSPTPAGAVPSVVDVNPDGTASAPFQGRVNALSVHPTNPNIVYAASELGGLWRSADGGLTWSHVDAVPMFVTRDVVIAPSDPNLIIVTGDYDGRTTSQGGIWRSTDGGVSWSKPATGDPSCGSEPSSYGIAVAPGAPGALRVFVADICGLAYSTDSGATWTHFSPNGTNGRLWDVVVRDLGGGTLQVDVCGGNRYRRSTTGGASAAAFTTGTHPVPTGFGPCTVDTAPQDPNTVYLTFYSGTTPAGFCIPEIDQSTDGGTTWTNMGPSDSNCRNPWVVTHPALDGDAAHYEVYIGTGNKVRHQHCDSTIATGCLAGVGNWAQVDTGAHADPSDIVFDTTVPNGCPRLLSTDGGIFRTTVAPAMCATTYNWTRSNTGLHTLDIGQLAGTVNPASTDLYFGTQDNGIYYTGDGGATYTATGPDVYNVYADHTPPARVLWRPCFGCSGQISSPGLAATAPFPLPPGDDVPNNWVATQFGPQSYAFVTRNGPPPNNNWKVEVTTNEGGAWAQMGPASLPGAPAAVYHPSFPAIQASGPAGSPTFFLLLNAGGINRVYRLTGPFDNTATVTLANAGLTNPVRFAVDPSDPSLLYAYDIVGGVGRMMRSTNGGTSWTPDDEISTLITRGGEFDTVSGVGPLVTTISFDPNSDVIMVGTTTAGIFGSIDNGANWFSVAGAEALPRASDFFFDERTSSIYVTTRGRGLWRITNLPRTTVTTLSSSVNPSEFGQAVTFTATVTPVPAGPPPPTGTVTFTIDGTPVATRPLDLANPGHATFTVAALQPGPHTVVATYNGDASYNDSTSAPLVQTVICDTNLTGNQGNLDLGPGSWCLNGVNSSGSITIHDGAAVSIVNSSVLGSITSTGASALHLCFVRVVTGGLTVRDSTGFVLVGDPADHHCAGNSVRGPGLVENNTGGVEIASSSFGGLTLTNTSGVGPFDEDSAPQIEGNRVFGNLACSGNVPAPTNDGRPNTVTGTRGGQCSAPGF